MQIYLMSLNCNSTDCVYLWPEKLNIMLAFMMWGMEYDKISLTATVGLWEITMEYCV